MCMNKAFKPPDTLARSSAKTEVRDCKTRLQNETICTDAELPAVSNILFAHTFAQWCICSTYLFGRRVVIRQWRIIPLTVPLRRLPSYTAARLQLPLDGKKKNTCTRCAHSRHNTSSMTLDETRRRNTRTQRQAPNFATTVISLNSTRNPCAPVMFVCTMSGYGLCFSSTRVSFSYSRSDDYDDGDDKRQPRCWRWW